MTSGKDTSISVRLNTWVLQSQWMPPVYELYFSGQLTITQFDTLNFREMVIARPTDLSLKKQSMVKRKLPS